MPKTHSSLPFIKWVALAALLAVLTACGGGGGSSPPTNDPTPTPTPTPIPTLEPDTTPEAFSFETKGDVELSAEVTSDPQTISGIDTASPVSVTGGLYAVNGGAFTGEDGIVSNGDQVTVRTTASSQFSQSVVVTLAVGDVEGTFTVTTLAQDLTPDQFSFVDQEGVSLSTLITSASMAIQGINDLTSVTITGGEYSVNGGGPTSEAGTVVQGDNIVVSAISAATVSTTIDVILTVGGVSDTFSLTTVADATPPEMEVYFPTPVSLTEGDSIVVRGVVSDNSGEVASVTVNGVIATLSASGDFFTWQTPVDLVEGENPIVVVATDALGNSTADVMAIVTRGDLSQSFPVPSMPLEGLGELEFGANQNQILVVDSLANRFYRIDTLTGLVEPVIDSSDFGYRTGIAAVAGGETQVFVVGENFSIDVVNSSANEKSFFDYSPLDTSAVVPWAEYQSNNSLSEKGPSLILADTYNLELLEVDVASGVETILSDINVSGDMWSALRSLELSEGYDKILVSDDVNKTITAVDKFTGERQVLSSSMIPDENNLLTAPKGISIAGSGTVAYVADGNNEESAIVSISLEEDTLGKRVWISRNSTPHTFNQLTNPSSILADESRGIAYVTDASSVSPGFDIYYTGPYHKLFVVDLITGYRVILAKSAENEEGSSGDESSEE